MKGPASTRPKSPVPALSEGARQWLSPLTFSIAALALAVAVFAIYSPALNFQFILDDHHFTADPRLQSSGHVWEYFANYVWAQFPGGPPSFYRPLFILWLRVNFILTGMSSWGWHLLSIAKHVAVAALLGALVWKLLRDRIAALIAGTLFALHPAQTESVAWVTVPDPLMSACVLGALLLYLKYAEEISNARRIPERKSGRKYRQAMQAKKTGPPPVVWLLASAVVCFAALLAKETAIVLPAVIFVISLLLPRSEPAQAGGVKNQGADFQFRLLRALRQTLPFFCATALYLLLRFNALADRLSPPTQNLSWSTVVLSWPATLWFYVKVLLWPVRSRAFADPILASSFSVRGVLLPALGVGCAVVILRAALFLVWRKARRDLPNQEATRVEYALLMGTLLLVLPILLTLDLNALNPGDFLHGRYTYLPLAGLMLLLATAWHLSGKMRIPLLCVAGLLTAGFSVLTVAQEMQWKDDLTVYTVAHQVAPHNAPVARNLANTHVQAALRLDEEGRCNEAIPVFEQVTQEYPQDWFAWAALGDCFVQLNDLPKAEESLHHAADLSHQPRVIQQWQEVRSRMQEQSPAPQR
jgi:Tetratricopeptide repeat